MEIYLMQSLVCFLRDDLSLCVFVSQPEVLVESSLHPSSQKYRSQCLERCCHVVVMASPRNYNYIAATSQGHNGNMAAVRPGHSPQRACYTAGGN